MTKRCLCPVAICFIFGLIFSLKDIKWILVPFGILEIYIFLRLKNYNMIKRALFIAGLLFATFVFSAIWSYKIENKRFKYLNDLSDGQTILVQGRLYKKEAKGDRYNLYLDKARIAINDTSVLCGDILVSSESDNYVLGNILVVEGRYREFDVARNEGNYDEKNTYYSNGIDIKIDSVCNIKEYGNDMTYRERLHQMKDKMKNVMQLYLGEEYYPLLSAVVLGDKTDVTSEEKELYKKAGLSHILSVSGLHISLLCLGFFELLRKLKCSRIVSIILAVMFGVIYCTFSGASVSTQRAVGMFIASMIAMSLGEAYDMLSALCFMGIIILLTNPLALFAPGFLLSFGAVIGISVTAKCFQDFYGVLSKRRDFLRSYKRHLSRKNEKLFARKITRYFDNLSSVFIANISITITTFPIVLWFYYEIPTLSLFINMLAIPLMGLLVGLGFVGALFGTIYIPLGTFIIPTKYIIEFYRVLSHLVESVPFSTWIIGKPKMSGIIAYYVVLGVVLNVVRYYKENCLEANDNTPKAIGYEMRIFRRKIQMFYFSMLLCFGMSLAFLSFFVDKKPCIKMLDVGQGDGIFVRTDSGKDIFIDGGSSSVKKVGKYRIIPFLKCVGADNIDFWFISHPDEDHICGLIEALNNGYQVDKILVSKYIDRNGLFDEVVNLSKERGVQIIYLSANDELIVGNSHFKCISPYKKEMTTNDSSLVVLYQSENLEALFTGDVGKNAEKEIVNRICFENGEKLRLLKVAHHGSKSSSDEKFIEIFHPDIALISAGKNNSYGHPHKETLEILKDNKVEIHRTDLEGEIIIVDKNNKP
ncbi:MAG: DNA internalization-related competence protein ComEC/Rec2 [Lachnospiraceae bacterium]|nr:DNA internalization-related competence protein ComEC/Rec2 [Lachnospiraceae bacterium]